MNRRLFVGNLAPDVDRRQLEEIFLSAGVKPTVQIPIDRNNGGHRGFAFVEFGSPAEAEHVLVTLNGRQVGGRAIRLGWAREPERPVSEYRERHTGRDRTRYGVDATRVLRFDAHDPRDEEVGPIDNDYSSQHAAKRRKGGKHGSDRLRNRGMRRRID